MKKPNLLILLFMFTALISCSSDDDTIIVSDNMILGRWIGVDVDYSGRTVTQTQGQTVNADFVGEAFDVDYTLVFNENPNTLSSEGSYSVNLTTTVNGQTNMQTIEGIGFLENGSWSVSGNQITIENNGNTSTATIVELTEDSLILSATEEVDLSQPGASIISTIDIVVTFTR